MSDPYTLLVDFGNSRLKWALATPHGWRGGFAAPVEGGAKPDLDRLWGEVVTPRRVLIASVRGESARHAVDLWCRRRWTLAPEFLDPTRPVTGISNGYRDPAQLGPDRWAAVIGAQALGPVPAVVIDCGTAITVDVVSRDNRYLGGAILPGLDLARDSLRGRAERIADVSPRSVALVGRSTAECVASGVLYGAAGGIDRYLDELETALGDPLHALLTGGDAPRLQPLLKRTVTLEPELVLRGLAEMLKRDEMGVRNSGIG